MSPVAQFYTGKAGDMQEEILSDNALKNDLMNIISRHSGMRDFPHGGCIHLHEAEQLFGQVIGKIASSRFYTFDDVTVEELLHELNKNPAATSVGVIDRGSGSVQGVVTRDMFFDILGRPFGRDLYKNKMIRKIVMTARCFRYTNNIFSISNELAHDLTQNKDIHYVLTDDDGRFVGVFTNRDLLMYLSYLTRRDIAFAKNIQSSIINEETIFKNDYCEMLAATKMAKDIGGDYYIMKKYNGTNWFLAVCDVAGKGISASLLSVLVAGMNHIFDFEKGVKPYIIKLNDFIYNSFRSEKFITGIFADFNESTGKIVIYDAGHSYLFLNRNKKNIALKSVSENLPVGISSKYNPVSYSFTLKKDDLLVLYTDGIIDQTNSEGGRYGLERFQYFFIKHRGENLKIFKDIIYNDVHKFRSHQTQDDDMTMLLLRYMS
jgi:sigma-B regulation protein RsbU (phosphoserine phosphatase)